LSDARARIEALGFAPEQAQILAAHFEDAEGRGRTGHGLTRIDWLATLPDLDPHATPERTVHEPAYERWDGAGALGYLVLEAVVASQLADPPAGARLIVARHCFPTGHLGYWTRRLADAGLVAVLTATSPPRLPHPEGGAPLIGTIPLSIAIPSSDGAPIVSDVSMAKATYGDILAGRASEADLVPFGGEQAHKAFALGLGLQLLVEAMAGTEGYGAVLLVARPEADPVPPLRTRAGSARLPGDMPTG
jgi:(2R)-3-sulfolactate dehydrogenase (NADP+)